jgi:hypothetical protein
VTGAARPAAAFDEPVDEAEAEAEAREPEALEPDVAAAEAAVVAAEVASVAFVVDNGAAWAAAWHQDVSCPLAANAFVSPGQLL